jgi:hypothetical protein
MTIAVAAMLLPAPALAADERRLSPAEVEQVLEKAAQKRDAPTVSDPAAVLEKRPARPVEGEMGVAIGTGGYREVFGTAVVPVRAEGVAIISFDSVGSRREYKRRR